MEISCCDIYPWCPEWLKILTTEVNEAINNTKSNINEWTQDHVTQPAINTGDTITKFLDWYSGKDVGYTGSGWGHGPRQWVAEQIALPNTVNSLPLLLIHSLLQDDSVTLSQGPSKIERYGGSEGLGLVKRDLNFLSFQNNLISLAENNPKYEKEPFSLQNNFEYIEFGGERGSWEITDKATWEVAGNDLTWMLRHATVGGRVDVGQDGDVQITYTLYDVLDLRPENDRSDLYKKIVSGLGFVYHDILGGNDEMEINATWIYRTP